MSLQEISLAVGSFGGVLVGTVAVVQLMLTHRWRKAKVTDELVAEVISTVGGIVFCIGNATMSVRK